MSDSNQPYDPSAPEGAGGGGSAYVSRKDVRIIAVGVVCLSIILFPIYKAMEKNSERARCLQNMKALSAAINEYAALHDDRFPPIMRTQLNGAPDLGNTGLPYTWASDAAEFMSPRSSFLCPSASPDEIVYVEGKGGTKIPVTYGMYAPYGGYLRSIVDNPDQTIILAETSNNGALKTFDPVPFVGMKGEKIPHDGFVIGWDNDNFEANEQTRFVTRLAFPESAGGKFVKDGPMRHEKGLHGIVVSGAASSYITPLQARVEMKFGLPGGMWAVPPVSKRQPRN